MKTQKCSPGRTPVSEVARIPPDRAFLEKPWGHKNPQHVAQEQRSPARHCLHILCEDHERQNKAFCYIFSLLNPRPN
jgi:hypothetical protein